MVFVPWQKIGALDYYLHGSVEVQVSHQAALSRQDAFIVTSRCIHELGILTRPNMLHLLELRNNEITQEKYIVCFDPGIGTVCSSILLQLILCLPPLQLIITFSLFTTVAVRVAHTSAGLQHMTNPDVYMMYLMLQSASDPCHLPTKFDVDCQVLYHACWVVHPL